MKHLLNGVSISFCFGKQLSVTKQADSCYHSSNTLSYSFIQLRVQGKLIYLNLVLTGPTAKKDKQTRDLHANEIMIGLSFCT